MITEAVMILLCALAAAPAAEVPDPVFEQAVQDYRAGRYGEAATGFLSVHQSEGDPALLYNAARAYARLDDVPRALRYYKEYLRDATSPQDRGAVEAAIQGLEARLAGRGLQQLSIRSAPAGAELVVDELPVGVTPWAGEIAPGRHLVRLRLTGHAEVERSLQLEPLRSQEVEVILVPERRRPEPVAAVAPANDASALASSSPTPAGRERTNAPPASAVPAAALGVGPAPVPAGALTAVEPLTWAALGSGTALLGGSLALELMRRDAEATAAAEQTQLGYRNSYQQMTDFQSASRVLLGVGAAGLGAAGLLLYLDVSGGTAAGPTSLAPAP